MDLETRHLAAFVGKVTVHVRDILSHTQVERFEIRRGGPEGGVWPHWMALTEPLDCTSGALVEEELTRAFWFDPRHHHGDAAREGAISGDQPVYIAWRGSGYPGSARLQA